MKIVATDARLSTAVLLLVLSALFFAGCATHRRPEFEFSDEAQATKLPDFLVGPASALLTNVDSFSARLTVDQPANSNNVNAGSGQLLVFGSHLLFAPKTGDRAFIWDARERTGFILSDALQGYAPISSPVRITNIMITAQMAGSAETQVNGYPGHEAEVSVASDDGSTAMFSIWRATDLGGFPVRIKTMNTVPPFTLNLSGVRSENLSPKLFLPPDGFTKYASADAMAGELYARKSKLKNATANRGASREPPSGVNYSK
jgi:hypothetical protein